MATGTPPLAFTVALFVLGSIPENIAPYLTVALVVVPMSVYLPVFAYAGFRHTARTGRQHLEKQIPTSCIICGEPLPKAALGQVRKVQGPHYETVHPDFWRWVEKSRRRKMRAVLPMAFVIWAVAGYELVISNYLLFIAGGALSAVLALIWNLLEKRKLKSFRSQWRHSPSTL